MSDKNRHRLSICDLGLGVHQVGLAGTQPEIWQKMKNKCGKNAESVRSSAFPHGVADLHDVQALGYLTSMVTAQCIDCCFSFTDSRLYREAHWQPVSRRSHPDHPTEQCASQWPRGSLQLHGQYSPWQRCWGIVGESAGNVQPQIF